METRVAGLSRLMPNVGGPSSCKRRLLALVAHSIIFYAAPVWAGVLRIKRYRDMLISAQRMSLIRVISAYRTISASAAQVIAGVPPIHLLVEERAKMYEEQSPSPDREATIRAWQLEWTENEDVAIWTRSLIKEVGPWMGCAHRNVDYYLTQILSAHGTFGSYLKRIGKKPDDQCTELDVENLIPIMLGSKENWKVIHTMIRNVMKQKEEDDRSMR
ncbi:uncharacterized protein LOC108914939 [Anoplophora glabripennis]|uniref:uncharacterized protein LOC108914939 n=1 Tax=Anoplophora glabripennis TaxID=217634 RepID=UPI0008759EA2|nr:uncharacterized protein LOC108914939 [Anoplophora glabripennis]